MKRLAAILVLSFGALSLAGEEASHVTIAPKRDGWTIPDLLKLASEQCGVDIVLDTEVVTVRRVEFIGTQRVPKDQFFAWMQSLLSCQRLVMVPCEVRGKSYYLVIEAPRTPGCRPVVLNVEDLDKWKNRPDARVLLMHGLKHSDPSELCEILADLTASRSMELVPSDHPRGILIYGPVKDLLLLRDVVSRLDVLPVEIQRESTRLEKLLAECRTETAADYFARRIWNLRGEE